MVNQVDALILRGAVSPDNDEQYRYWTYDLRSMKVFSEFGSNHDIEDNLVDAGVVVEVPNSISWDDAPCPKTDSEYSQFWIFFETEAQMRQWVQELVQYTEWLEENAKFVSLAIRYKEVNSKDA